MWAETELKEKENSCRPSTTMKRVASDRGRALIRLEHLRLELVALEQLVELRAVALRELGCLRDAASRDAQYADKVLAFEGATRLLERGKLGRLLLQRLLHQRGRNHAGSAKRDHLLDHVDELPHVARPGG